jgi:hypothetical protein
MFGFSSDLAPSPAASREHKEEKRCEASESQERNGDVNDIPNPLSLAHGATRKLNL